MNIETKHFVATLEELFENDYFSLEEDVPVGTREYLYTTALPHLLYAVLRTVEIRTFANFRGRYYLDQLFTDNRYGVDGLENWKKLLDEADHFTKNLREAIEEYEAESRSR